MSENFETPLGPCTNEGTSSTTRNSKENHFVISKCKRYVLTISQSFLSSNYKFFEEKLVLQNTHRSGQSY